MGETAMGRDGEWASGCICVPEGLNDRSQAIYCLERRPNTAVPLGYGVMGFEERGGATMASPVAHLGIPWQRSYRPYGTDPFSTQFPAINCLATIIQSPPDPNTPIRPIPPSPSH